jgi:hypothetical protein
MTSTTIHPDDIPTTGLARANDSSTAKAGARKAERTTLAARTLCALRDYGPMTTVEIAQKLGCGRDSISPRMTTLVRGNWVEDTGRERDGRTVWAAKGCLTGSLFAPPPRHSMITNEDALEREPMDDCIELALCEAETLVLHPYRRYRFIPYADCVACMKRLDQFNSTQIVKVGPR